MATTDDLSPSTSPTSPTVTRSPQRRVLAVLAATQVFGGIGTATGLAVSALLATRLSGSESIGGLATTGAVLGAGLIAIPVARVATRRGRRPAVAGAYGCATLGAVVSVAATAIGWWPLLIAGLTAFGAGTAANLSARYAATDLSRPGRAARDLSMVVWATTIGAVLGPNLAQPAAQLGPPLGLPAASGPYVLSALAFGLATAGIAVGLRPDPLQIARRGRPAQTAKGSSAAAWRVVRSSPPARLAVAAIVVGHTTMVSLMTMTPVHLDHGGATLTIVGIVISAHIAGMYAPSPLVGWCADRFGRRPLLLAGALQLLAAAVIAGPAAPHHSGQITIGLVLLGTGWSCSLIAGSALLTESVPSTVRPAVQGLSDLLMNVGAAVGGLTAGAIFAVGSYGTLAAATAVIVVPLALWTLTTIRSNLGMTNPAR